MNQDCRGSYGDSVSTVNGPWKDRKTAYIAHIADAPRSVRLVSVCDKLHNARAILADYQALGDDLWGRFNAPKDQILWYYRSLANAFLEAGQADDPGFRRVPAELHRVVSELERTAL